MFQPFYFNFFFFRSDWLRIMKAFDNSFVSPRCVYVFVCLFIVFLSVNFTRVFYELHDFVSCVSVCFFFSFSWHVYSSILFILFKPQFLPPLFSSVIYIQLNTVSYIHVQSNFISVRLYSLRSCYSTMLFIPFHYLVT